MFGRAPYEEQGMPANVTTRTASASEKDQRRLGAVMACVQWSNGCCHTDRTCEHETGLPADSPIWKGLHELHLTIYRHLSVFEGFAAQ